jgi:hypothetical protein
LSDGTNGVVVIGPFHLYGPGLSAIVIVLVYTLTPPKETVNEQDAEFVIEWKSYQKVNVYSRVVSNEYRVWYILALEGVNEVAEFKMAYTDPSCAAACSRFGYVRPPCPLDQELILPEGPEPTMSSNDGLSRMFTPGGKVETDGFTEDDTTVVEIISDEEGVGVGKGVGVSRLLTTSDENDIEELLMGSVDKGVAEMLTTSDDEGVGVGVGVSGLLRTSNEDDVAELPTTSDDEGVGVGVGVSGLLRTSNEDDVAELPTTSDEDGVAELMTDDEIGSDELGVGVGELLENSVLVATVEELSTDEDVGV